MKAPVCRRSAYALLRLGLLGLIFVVVAHTPAAAQTCTGNCAAIVYAGTTGDALCFTNSPGSCSGTTATIFFGQTVDFYQPSGVALFDAHTATAGSCPGGICSPNGNFRVPSLSSPCGGGGHYFCNNVDNYVPFDGVTVPTGGSAPLNAGSYTYYCQPHGSGMTATIQVNPDTTSVSLSSGSPSPSVVFQAVNGFTVTVSNATGVGIIPSGQARLLVDGVAVTAFVALSNGSFTFNGITFNSPGLHSVTAQFQDPNGNFASNTSNTVFQQVNPDSTSVSLSSRQSQSFGD